MPDIFLWILAIAILVWLYRWGTSQFDPRSGNETDTKSTANDPNQAEKKKYRMLVICAVGGAVLLLWLGLVMILILLGSIMTGS